MQSFTFNELDERGQANASNKYFSEYLEETDQYGKELETSFSGWRFTEHGERIA